MSLGGAAQVAVAHCPNERKLGWNRGGVTQEQKKLQYLRNGAR